MSFPALCTAQSIRTFVSGGLAVILPHPYENPVRPRRTIFHAKGLSVRGRRHSMVFLLGNVPGNKTPHGDGLEYARHENHTFVSFVQGILRDMTPHYEPPYTITPDILGLVARISESVGRQTALAESAGSLRLRRINRVRTIQGSLAIEGNTLSEGQITAILEGKRVVAPPREIQEARNAIAAYERMPGWMPEAEADLLEAHRMLMVGLMDDAGTFRSGGVGVMAGASVIHMAPPAHRVPVLMGDLLGWLGNCDTHPLVTSSVFHYEFEFIHPFSDGNGRLGRLWQTLILTKWNPLFAHIPVESMVHEHQEQYYIALQQSTRQTDSAPFVAFMLRRVLDALAAATDQVGDQVADQVADQASDQVSDQVARLLAALGNGELGSSDLIGVLGLSHLPSFRERYLNPALEDGWIERTHPESPRSPAQRYRLTARGREWLQRAGR